MQYPRKISLLFILILIIGVLSVFIYLKLFLNNSVTVDHPEENNPVALYNFTE